MPEIDKEKEHEEYLTILAAFQKFVDRVSKGMEPEDAFEELVSLRAEFGIRHAFAGFGMEWDEALALIRSKEGLSELDRTRRDILVAAVDNIVDFATAEEYQMVAELSDFEESEQEDDDEDFTEEQMELWLSICAKYNERYAHVENLDIEYAMMIAATMALYPSSTTLMYMTMGDERVRPWHLQFEGFTAPKSEFPAWLIPPIEHQCRCYLIADNHDISVDQVQNSKMPEMPDWFNRTFKESVALGGRIFSDEHPYFEIDAAHMSRLTSISQKIKLLYFDA